MTTLAVVRKGGLAAIAADSLTSFGELRLDAVSTIGKSKLLAVGDAILGLSGSSANQAVLESYFSDRKRKRDFGSRKGIFETWRRMHAVLKDDYFMNPKDQETDPWENTQPVALVASPAGIFGVYPFRDVHEFSRFWSMGSGRELALGALGALYDRLETAEEVAREAVAVAATLDKSSALPVEVRTIRLRPARR